MMAVLITAELATLAGERGKVGMYGAVRGQGLERPLLPATQPQGPISTPAGENRFQEVVITRPTPTVCYSDI